MKLSTINLIVEGIIEQGYQRAYAENNDLTSQEILDSAFKIANEATIYLKTALICEDGSGIDKAMEYFTGTHSEDEYAEWRTSVVEPQDLGDD